MTTARSIVEGALGFGLNRLSPGETLDADTANSCLVALNMICDEFNGSGSFLFREILTSGTIGGAWPTIASGTQILGFTYNDGAGDTIIERWTMAQYQSVFDKTTSGEPEYWAYDGYSTIYFYPSDNGVSVTMRTRQTFSDFADLDTDYAMPQGYKTAMADLLAEKMAPQLLGLVPAAVARNAAAARNRLLAKNMNPAIINAGTARPNIISGP